MFQHSTLVIKNKLNFCGYLQFISFFLFIFLNSFPARLESMNSLQNESFFICILFFSSLCTFPAELYGDFLSRISF